MIPAGVQVFVSLDPVDLRAGFERLAGFAREHLGGDARSGALFVFFGRRRATVKVLFFDGSGMCLFHKRLDRGTFELPERSTPDVSHVEIDDAALETLLDGLPIHATSEPLPRRPAGALH